MISVPDCMCIDEQRSSPKYLTMDVAIIKLLLWLSRRRNTKYKFRYWNNHKWDLRRSQICFRSVRTRMSGLFLRMSYPGIIEVTCQRSHQTPGSHIGWAVFC